MDVDGACLAVEGEPLSLVALVALVEAADQVPVIHIGERRLSPLRKDKLPPGPCLLV
jgi:hypothetical protein